jgi:hypothetical protein
LLLLGTTVGQHGAQGTPGRHHQAAQQVVEGAEAAVGDAEQHRQAQRVQPDAGGVLGAEAGGGQQRPGDQQAEQDRAAAGPGVQQRDDGGDQHRHQHRPALGLHRGLLANRGSHQRKISDGR